MDDEGHPADFGTAVLVDRATRATAALFEIVLDAAIAGEWLGRAPDVAADGILAWGGLSAEQIRELLDLCGDQDGRILWDEILAQHAARDLFISLCWRKRGVVDGE